MELSAKNNALPEPYNIRFNNGEMMVKIAEKWVNLPIKFFQNVFEKIILILKIFKGKYIMRQMELAGICLRMLSLKTCMQITIITMMTEGIIV